MLIIIAIILCALKEFPSTSAIPTDLFDELWPTNFGSPPPGEAAQENAIEKHQNAKQQKSHGQKRRIKTEPAEDYDPNYGANRQQLNGKWPKLAAVKAEVSTLINDDVGHLGAPIKVEQGENCTVKVEKVAEHAHIAATDAIDLQTAKVDQNPTHFTAVQYENESDQSDNSLSNRSENVKQKYSDLEKLEIVKKFFELKAKRVAAKDKAKLNEQINKEIANELGTGVSTIYTWKREFNIGMENFDETEKQKEIVKLFQKYKKQNKEKKNIEIAKELGIHQNKLLEFRKRFDPTYKKRLLAKSEKIALVKKYYKLKRKFPELSQNKIVKILKISKNALITWKHQFGNQFEEQVDLQQENDGEANSEETSAKNVSSKNADETIWAWNNETQKRSRKRTKLIAKIG